MPEITITGFRTRDVRFPTSLDKTGSDAMNAAGDYSSAYCILETDSQHTGHGMVNLSLPRASACCASIADGPLSRPSPSAVATTLSAPPSAMSQTASRARPSPPSSPTGARRGATSSRTANCAGSALRKASSTWPSAPSSTPSGTCGPACSTNPSGASSPR